MTPHARKESRRTTSLFARPRVASEALERRMLMAADKAPTVEGLFVSGTEWSPAFLAYLESTHNGSTAAGFEAAGKGGPNAILPWVNLNELSVQFSEDVDVEQGDLAIASAAGTTYNVTGFSYDEATFTATWTLDQPIDADILTVSLAGVTDSTGNALLGDNKTGVFATEISILPGDGNRDGIVDGADADEAFERSFSRADDTRIGPGFPKYSIFFDVDGSADIGGADVGAIRQRLGTTLPS